MEVFIQQLLQGFWLYGGSYFGALATASSFYALFFFFWTRTGERAQKVDLETKAIYLYPIYKILRFSLVMIILSKIAEVFILKNLANLAEMNVSALDIIISQNGAFLYTVILITAINSYLMATRKINYAYAIPMAVTSYFFIFIYSTRNVYADVSNFFVPAGDVIIGQFSWYMASVIGFGLVFNYFSHKVRKNEK